MTTVYLALGSNVGDPARHITKAINLLSAVLHNIKQAPLYSSKPIGFTDQADFLNTAISGQTELSPQELLQAINNVEQQVGRVKRFRWGPREIDIDIIFYGDQLLQTESLTIPHPSFKERDFVLRPLLDLDSKIIDPASHKTIKQLLDNLDASQLSIIHKVQWLSGAGQDF